jgi:fatty acid desaturase
LTTATKGAKVFEELLAARARDRAKVQAVQNTSAGIVVAAVMLWQLLKWALLFAVLGVVWILWVVFVVVFGAFFTKQRSRGSLG